MTVVARGTPAPGRLGAPLIIAGGGIGGLAAAYGLAARGFAVVVLEKSPVLGEVGAGIQLGPNAFHAFDALGLGATVRRLAIHIDRLRLMDALTAEEIAHIDLGEAFRSRFGAPYAVVHRGELHGVLVRACQEHPLVDLRTDCEVTGYDQDAGGVTARLAGGGSVTGAALIGADGLWSNIRQQLVGDGAPRISGHSTYRAVIPTEDMPQDLRWNAATLWAGPKCHIVHYPLSGWKQFNLVVTYHNDVETAVAGQPVDDEEVARGFQHVHERARQIIGRGRDWRLWVLCDREPVENWTDGRVTLLGDAAHPTLQYLAQGACMAIEDAVCLAECLDAHEPERAMALYQGRRLTRTARVQLMSREVGDHIYHPAGAHARLRNEIMAAKTSAQYCEHLAWLYDGPDRPDGSDGSQTSGGLPRS